MREGSRGLKNKNHKLLLGKPLLYYTIKQAQNSKLFDKIVVSTDSAKIFNLSKKYGADVWFKRPKKLSSSKSAKLDVVKHALRESERKFNKSFDIICDLDVTSPLRNIKDIKNSYLKFKNDNANNLFTVNLARKNPYFNQIELRNEKVNIVKKINKLPVRRQDAPIVYDVNASIYFWKRKVLINNKSIFSSKTSIYVMPYSRSIDIDDYTDWKLVEYFMGKKR